MGRIVWERMQVKRPMGMPGMWRPVGLSATTVALLFIQLVIGGAIYSLLDSDQQYIAAPALMLLCVGSVFLAEIWRRDGEFPLLDIGIWTVGTTLLYATLPLVQHLAAGMEWSILSDNRLLQLSPTPEEFGEHAWNHVAYLLSFAATYLAARRTRDRKELPVRLPEPCIVICAVVFFVGSTLLSGAIDRAYGVTVDFYGEGKLENVARLQAMPLFVRQVRIHSSSSRLLFEVVTVMALISRLQRRWARLGVWAWLVAQLAVTLTVFGARTYLIFSILIVILLYHRIKGHIRFYLIATAGVILLSGAIMYGLAREYLSASAEVDIQSTGVNPLSASNEFMALYATSYDVQSRLQSGTLPVFPVQGLFAEFLMLIPQQLLPFDKVDPSEWYLEVIGAKDEGVGFMWGVMSSAAVGLGKAELIIRGVLLGMVFAWVHRWYVRNGSDWRVLSLYAIMCLWAYYTFRASTFYFLVFIEYNYLLPLLMLSIGQMVGRGMRRGYGVDQERAAVGGAR